MLRFCADASARKQRFIASFSDAADVLQFIDSADAKELAFLGTSCPDHFIRTKIRPMFVPWGAGEDLNALKNQIDHRAVPSTASNTARITAHSPRRSRRRCAIASPAVVLIPGMGMFSFGKNKTEARITGEFYTNAIHVMEGASLLGEGEVAGPVPQCQPGMDPASFKVFTELRGVAGAGSLSHRVLGAGRREDSTPAAGEGTEPLGGAGDWRSQRHWPRSGAAGCRARRACFHCRSQCGGRGARLRRSWHRWRRPEFCASGAVDIRSRASIREMLDAASLDFGGIDILINTAALFPSTPDGEIPDNMWADTLAVNVTANYLLADEAAKLFEEQGLHGSIVFTSSANAVVAKRGSEAYDVSKAALSHLIRELSVCWRPMCA